jgi:2-polyprenyl-3-methyl-5-hydroxy-6-metoxy-1,4-benzoquinol methylase
MVLDMHDAARTSERFPRPWSEDRADLAAYEALAPHLREYARRRAAYLDAVDGVIVASITGHPGSLLDVGAGDGERSIRIAQTCGISVIILAEPCHALQEECRRQPATGVWPRRAEELPDGPPGFDVITCLWNVLGHVRSQELRLRALTRMRALLNPGGRLFLDVNNRYNARAYGWTRTSSRIIKDCLRPSERNGDVAITWQIGGGQIHAVGHVFTPREMRGLLREARLRVVRRHVLDYASGARHRCILEGQLLYELTSA